MSRSIKKGPFVHAGPLKKIEEMNQDRDRRVIRVWSGSSAIFPQMIGHVIAAHSGRKYIPVYVIESMVGYKLGEPVLIRISKGHTKNEKTSERK